MKLGAADVCKHVGLGPLLWEDKLVDSGLRLVPRFTMSITLRCFSVCVHCLVSRVEPAPWPSCSLSSPLASPSQPSIAAALYFGSFSTFSSFCKQGPMWFDLKSYVGPPSPLSGQRNLASKGTISEVRVNSGATFGHTSCALTQICIFGLRKAGGKSFVGSIFCGLEPGPGPFGKIAPRIMSLQNLPNIPGRF